MSVRTDLDELLSALSDEGGPVLAELARLNESAVQASGLDEKTAVLVRLAALVAMDASPASYLVHLRLADDAGLEPAMVQGMLVEIAPLVGTARVVSAAGKARQAINSV
jgi:hypothetical protein